MNRLVYEDFIISTIVDIFPLIPYYFSVYEDFIISTIVDGNLCDMSPQMSMRTS